MALRYNVHSSSGTLDTLVAGSQVNGTAVEIGDGVRLKVKHLSALVVVEAETNGITMTCKWQVSRDGSTWVDVANGSQNAAGVALATGTAGDDAVVTKLIPAPDCVSGWRKARLSIVTGAQTGAATDTYEISYCYRSVRSLEG